MPNWIGPRCEPVSAAGRHAYYLRVEHAAEILKRAQHHHMTELDARFARQYLEDGLAEVERAMRESQPDVDQLQLPI